jgi:iron complex transport system permease protein
MSAMSLPARLCLGLVLLVPVLAAASQSFALPDPALFYHRALPRLIMSLLAGGALALAGAVMQQTLRNPLATPATLGVVSGSQFALLLATVAWPGGLALGRDWIATLGGTLAMSGVIALAWRQRLAPVVVVLAGIVVNLYLGALGTVVLLLHQEELYGILIWGAGSLAESGWGDIAYLGPRLLLAVPLIGLLLRPLDALSLGESQARGLGIGLQHLRLGALGLAVLLAAFVTSVVGVVGFVGLAAPMAVRLLGVRRFAPVAVWSTVLGALLLTATDLVLQVLGNTMAMLIPTGAMTSVLGGVLLLWLLPRLNLGGKPPAAVQSVTPGVGAAARWGLVLAAPAVAIALALMTGQSLSGWHWLDPGHARDMLEWRLPRTIAAGSAGAILAVAGAILQRLTGNPMASPEVLGVSGGAALGFIAALFLIPGVSALALVGGGLLGAMAGIALVLSINRRHGFAPDMILLSGVAITAAVNGFQSLMLAGGDPRGQQAIAWMSGSTYYVDMTAAGGIAGVAAVALVVTPLLSRWLDLLPLGPATARALGVPVRHSRLILLLAVAVMTACATLIVGPLSFAGLLAPHMARLAGFLRARDHLLGAAGVGFALMILADWIGRQVLYPQEIPAGLVAALVGGTYFIVGLRRL